jgi:ribosome maturation factor RimP
MQPRQNRLRDILGPSIKSLGFELVDVELSGGSRRVLRVFIDKPQGITVDDCAKVSRAISAVLDVEDPVPESYVLEVSSPGLDRPLVSEADFRRFLGEDVKVQVGQPLDGRRRFKGKLLEVTSEAIGLEVDGKRFELGLAGIERARLVPKL